jgi:hypothetical protein
MVTGAEPRAVVLTLSGLFLHSVRHQTDRPITWWLLARYLVRSRKKIRYYTSERIMRVSENNALNITSVDKYILPWGRETVVRKYVLSLNDK